MYPTIVHYGYAPPPYFDQNCPQCLQEHQALVFNNRAASTLNPLAKEFVPGQAFDPTGRDTTIGTANHHYCDDDKNSSDAVLLVNDTDAFPPTVSSTGQQKNRCKNRVRCSLPNHLTAR